MFLRRYRDFTKPLCGLVNRVVGVAGFEPATPTSRTREVRVEAKSLFRVKASPSTRTLRKYLILPNVGHLPGPPRSLAVWPFLETRDVDPLWVGFFAFGWRSLCSCWRTRRF